MLTKKKGWCRLFAAAWCLYAVAVAVLTVIEYNGRDNGLLVKVIRHQPEFELSDIRVARKSIKERVFAAKEMVDLGAPKGGKKATTQYDVLVPRKLIETERKVLSRIEGYGTGRRKQPFTKDYIKVIQESTGLPLGVIEEYPTDAENIYLLDDFERTISQSPISRSQFENRPSPDVSVRWENIALLLVILPAALMVVLFSLLWVLRWIRAGFRP